MTCATTAQQKNISADAAQELRYCKLYYLIDVHQLRNTVLVPAEAANILAQS